MNNYQNAQKNQQNTGKYMASFLPADYKSPSSSNRYFKLQDGENKIRILSAPILGWEDWDENANKPVRYRMNEKPAASIDPKKPIRHFWAMIVWDYVGEKICIWQVAQATIRKSIEMLSKDNDWGAPYFYDLKIHRTGQKTDTDYTVSPLPHKDLHPYIMEQFHETPCNLDALFSNGDPFAGSWAIYTAGVFSADQAPVIEKSGLSPDHMAKLKSMIEKDANQQECIKTLLAKCNVSSMGNIPEEKYDNVIKWVLERVAKQQMEINELPF